VRASGSPAFAVYQMGQDGIYSASALQILTIVDGQITDINDYLTFDGRLFLRFQLPLVV